MRARLSGSATAAALIVAIAAGVAWASIPDGGVIQGCYKKNDGGLRVIDLGAGGACGSSERSVSWNDTAPQGVQGPTGAVGPTGPIGPTGAQGAAGSGGLTQDPQTMIVVGTANGDPQIGGFFKQLQCPQGTKVLWGAWEWALFNDPMPPADVESFPGSDTTWDFAVSASNESKGVAAFLSIGCAVAR